MKLQIKQKDKGCTLDGVKWQHATLASLLKIEKEKKEKTCEEDLMKGSVELMKALEADHEFRVDEDPCDTDGEDEVEARGSVALVLHFGERKKRGTQDDLD